MKHAMVAVACLGHLVLMIGSHNWLYGLKISKRVGDLVHFAHALLVLALPLAVYALFGLDLEHLLYWMPLRGNELPNVLFAMRVMQLYLLFCLLTALLWLPGVTLQRLLRREPAERVRSEVVDVARELGRRPVGNGHHAFLADFPGNELFQLEIIEKKLTLPTLPAAWEGLTILHLSDLHFHGTPDRDWFAAVLAHCAKLEPDIVALTGDIVDSDTHQEWIEPLLGGLRGKIATLAILGNHDHRHNVQEIRRHLRELSMQVLENNWAQIDVRGQPMVVIGHEGPWVLGEPDLSSCPKQVFRLCLSHTPDNIAWARKNGIDLMLSGHVHGGQIRVWPFGSILVPSRYGRRHDQGTYDEPPTLLHVSRGLSGEHPVRYGCKPEVTLLRLHAPRGEKLPA